jgi:hypothetical protein
VGESFPSVLFSETAPLLKILLLISETASLLMTVLLFSETASWLMAVLQKKIFIIT